MSIDAPDEPRSVVAQPSSNGFSISVAQWDAFRLSVGKQSKRLSAKKVLGDASEGGTIYRWGMAAAANCECSPLIQTLSRLADDPKLSKKSLSSEELRQAAAHFLATIGSAAKCSALDSASAILWASSLPGLLDYFDSSLWWRMVASLRQLHAAALKLNRHDNYLHLMLGCELALTLAWRLPELEDAEQLSSSAEIVLEEWFEQGEVSIANALQHGGRDARLILASLIRCQRILRKLGRRKLASEQVKLAKQLATWTIALTTRTGDTAFGCLGRKTLADDLGELGLITAACEFSRQSLEPAAEAALGKAPQGGRLVWEINLPLALHHDADAKVAVLFSDWDVRRGRTHLDYAGEDVRLELFAGHSKLISGSWQTTIELDGEAQEPNGSWEEVCEFSDDDVHYLEIEQPWTGDLLLQRQLMLIREDRCVFIADAVLPANPSTDDSRLIKYSSRLPLANEIVFDPEQETREFFLSDAGQRQALVIPLSASEWRVGPTDARVEQTDDRGLLLTTQGRGRLFAPLWFDMQRRRFKRKRTWRQLTIGHQLRIVPRNESVGYRVQVGSEHWMMYRSLVACASRTVLGKHLNADFFASRFDPSDGDHEILVTVDDSEKTN
jgi:hypothetical protein